MHARVRQAAVAGAIALVVASVPVAAQQPVSAGPIPVEITIEGGARGIDCRPPRARLPERARLDMRLVNRSDHRVLFAAPRFFALATSTIGIGEGYDRDRGGVWIEPNRIARLALRTPPPGEYPYACFGAPNEAAHQAAGALVVVAVPPAG